jgi:hypothetical protein
VDAHAKGCDRCAAILKASQRLSYKRLGHQERRQLLSAAAPEEAPRPIHPPDPSPAAQTATRRAVANLDAFGLIRVASERLRVVAGEDDALLEKLGRKYAVMRLSRRTELGQEIVGRYRAELESGRPIRWFMHLNAATEAALLGCPKRKARGKKSVRLTRVPQRGQEAGR